MFPSKSPKTKKALLCKAPKGYLIKPTSRQSDEIEISCCHDNRGEEPMVPHPTIAGVVPTEHVEISLMIPTHSGREFSHS